MKKLLTLLFVILLIATKTFADEGMWLVNLLDKQLYELMANKGLKLKPGEIYNVEGGALTDAIVAIDGGMCSGSIISPKGLMITNHHCAFGDIHSLSTPEKNYLEDGFWAMNMSDEVPIKGKSVTFLRSVMDVTDIVTKIIDSLDAAGPRGLFFMNRVSGIIEKRFESSLYEKGLSSMWRGSKYYLYFFETFSDVRLVGAPPVSIGSFGGETDNWGWPQHKGDFAMYRVYASADGKPAEYSAENVPMEAKRFLTVSAKGVKEDDFTMVIGYPGRTNRYISSFELREKFEILNPVISGVRRAKLDVWKKYMDASDETRLIYSDKYFGISNYTDYAKWENLCVDRFNVIEELEGREKVLQDWIMSDSKRAEKYGKMLGNLREAYAVKADITKVREYFRESMVRGAELVGLGQRFQGLISSLTRAKKEEFTLEDKEISNFKEIALKALNELDPAADRELFKVMVKYYLNEVPTSFYDEAFVNLLARFNGNSDKLVDFVYDNSILTSKERLDDFFNQKRAISDIAADPIIDVVKTIGVRQYNAMEDSLLKAAELDPSKDRGDYVRAMYEMQLEKDVNVYPDANSTMRLTFGEIGGIKAKDAVYYHYLTTSTGILEKQNPNDYEFKIKPDLKAALEKGDWGRWGTNGVLYVNFLSDNDITGGNSGSAVMNGNGELIGLAFDGNRESMAGDVYYVEGYCKSVCVDIRYVLWVIEKYAGAGHLINEMNIVF
ncbi:MAG: S46 family peptidase [Bacteroidales bacterium]|nr:S46 family peptidase [Bacteroidales bacterium]